MVETLVVVLYCLVAGGAVVMTLREHSHTPRARILDLGAGLIACLAWPVLVLAVLWELRRSAMARRL